MTRNFIIGKCIAFVGDDAMDCGNEFLKLSLAVNTFALTDWLLGDADLSTN